MRLAIVVGLTLAGPALAQTQTQQNVMTHIARIVAISNKCAALKPNNLILGLLMRQHGINLDRQPYSDFVVAKGGEYAREIAGLDTAAACALGRKLYGKAGEKVQDLLRG